MSNASLLEQFKAEATALQPQLVAWRRDFHMHPELGFQEVRTAGVVADHLRSLGLEIATGIGKTGVVALVEPDSLPAEAPTVMLRFDMDALPIEEENDALYRSQTPGVMHACGHDGHTAIGMGVAQVLAQHRNELTGRVKLLFQPAEEGLGGALAMIADGALDSPKPAASFGLHLWSRLPLDQIVVQPGPLMAGADKVTLVVEGLGGHGAMPHETIDAIAVASQIVVAWQTIVARNIDPMTPAVITVGSFHAGSAANVIAERAELACSIRSFELETRDFLVRRMREVADGVCAAHGARCQLTFTAGVLPTVNSEAGAGLMRSVVADLFGPEKLTAMKPMMVGEDMSEFLARAPGCFVLVGAADPDGPLNSPHHSPTFDFDERMLSTGVALLAGAAAMYLERATR
ncbi:MAG: M20 family metallopeptidase [Caldilinea sp.]